MGIFGNWGIYYFCEFKLSSFLSFFLVLRNYRIIPKSAINSQKSDFFSDHHLGNFLIWESSLGIITSADSIPAVFCRRTRLPPFSLLACRRLLLQSSAFSFRGGDLTFRVSGVDYMAILKNFPFLKRLRVWLTGIRSASLFSFRVCAWYCTVHPFGNRCRTCSNFAGGFAHVSTGFFVF